MLYTTVTYLIIGLTVLTSVIAFPPNIPSIEGLRNPNVLNRFIFHPYSVWHYGQWWRMFSSGLIHAGWLHLFINMFVFYMFGRPIETYFVELFGIIKGEILFLVFYILALAFANLADLIKYRNNQLFSALGASGAVSATVFAFILFNPWERFIIFPFPFSVPAIFFAVFYLLYESLMDKFSNDRIGHNAHFWGSVFGFVFPIILEPRLFNHFINQLFQ